MKTTTLGKTGLEVSRLAFGTWEFGGDWGNFDENTATTTIRRARDLGFNFFDTAQQYGFGESERILGKALRPDLARSRDDVVIATKGGIRQTDDGLRRDASPEWLRAGADSSLRALGVDYIDLYMVHWPDPAVPESESAGALADLLSEGKIRHVGVSNYDTDQVRDFTATLPVEVVQPPYHLFRREIEHELLPYCRTHDIGVMVYGLLAHGLLTGTVKPGTTFAAGDWRRESDIFNGDGFLHNLEIVSQLNSLAADLGATISQLAIAWTLAQPDVHVAVVGAQHLNYLEDNVRATDIMLSDSDLAQIDQIMSSASPVSGPYPEMSRQGA